MKHYNVIVVGLGAMGSAALYQLSQRTNNILGIDQFSPPHNLGSSSGETRITRVANGEGEIYTLLALRANKIWKELEGKTGDSLLVQNGGLILAAEDARGKAFHGQPDFFAQTIKIAKKYNIKHDVLSADDIKQRFPQFNVVGTETAYYEYDAGYLLVEACINTQLALAKKQGAAINVQGKVLSVVPDGEGVIVTTSKGKYAASKVIISPGPWIKNLIGDEYKNIFKVYRQVSYWWGIKNNSTSFLPKNFPISIWLRGEEVYYGFPAVHGVEHGVRMGFDYVGSTTDPDKINRVVSDHETQMAYRRSVANRFPDLNNKCLKSTVCMLTFTTDANFIIDTLPDYPQIVVASPCSGGGFKHSAAIGQILAELATAEKPSIPIETFSISRFKIKDANSTAGNWS